jgi:hypothetical protein
MTDPTPRPVPKTAIRVSHIRFNTRGVIIASPKEAEDALTARETAAKPSGYDIWWLPERNAFRCDRYDGGKFRITKYVLGTNVHNYEEWPAEQPSVPAQPNMPAAAS